MVRAKPGNDHTNIASLRLENLHSSIQRGAACQTNSTKQQTAEAAITLYCCSEKYYKLKSLHCFVTGKIMHDIAIPPVMKEIIVYSVRRPFQFNEHV